MPAISNGDLAAFPHPEEGVEAVGLTKREYAAIQILAGFASDPTVTTTKGGTFACIAAEWADHLFAALDN